MNFIYLIQNTTVVVVVVVVVETITNNRIAIQCTINILIFIWTGWR